ncbi:I78 family peptidase inhibitor [Sphingomonas sp. AOB5]|uniref:I78 family peptidase inhibitor n=1 Tax=Sphingomonas sp. AOB5 TaxID=3034017 RepID=UPI0023F7EFB6|nr:I78 family peptidase inhibitor [Sphingomonas sp. AOB5]MDF7777679.1 I78 family peptidase inhibitor [Sphingomonas sp. AOB5]
MIRLTIPLIGFALVSCAPPPPASTPAPPTACGAEKVGKFVGKKRTDAISTEVAKLSGAKSIRWISPGMAVTMDYREDRLNVALDDKGVITRFYCS